MATEIPPPDDTPSETAPGLLAGLVQRLGSFEPRPGREVADALVFHLLLDVVEQAHAILALLARGYAGAAHPNARSALESAQALVLLTGGPEDFLTMAARFKGRELFDLELYAQQMHGGYPAQHPDASPPPTWDTITAAAEEEWEACAPGLGALLRREAERVRGNGKHKAARWSCLGGQDAEVEATMRAIGAEDPLDARRQRALIGGIALHAHPGHGAMQRGHSWTPDGELAIQPHPGEADMIRGGMHLALMFATMAMGKWDALGG